MICISTATHEEQYSATVFSRRLAGIRILLAEDHPDHQRLFALILHQEGAEVEVVGNGQLAIQYALEAQELGMPFDAILMDQQMPVLDGNAAARALRGYGYDRPIIALTAHAMLGEREKCLDCGCNEYLSKPIDRDLVVAILVRSIPSTRASLAIGV